MLYAGVDSHRGRCQVTVMEEDGTVVKRTSVPTTQCVLHGWRERQAVHSQSQTV